MLLIHHPPEGERTCEDFKVSVCGEKTVPYFARVSAIPYNTVWPGRQRPEEQTEIASFIGFEADGPVYIELEAWKDFADCTVRPLSKNIRPDTNGRRIAFTLNEPGQYTVELDGFHRALHIFFDPISIFGVDRSDADVLYYGPGIHRVGKVELNDNQTAYIDAGAVVYGSFTAINKSNVRIVGYGVVDGSEEVRTSETGLLAYSFEGVDLTDEKALRELLRKNAVLDGCVRLYNCSDSSVEGVTLRDSATFALIMAGCTGCRCDRVKTIGMWRYNSDGIDLFNCRGCRIENCFLRDFDDCIVLKGIKGWDKNNMEDITVRGCTVWCDWGRALEIGAETCADEYRNILFENCDIIRCAHYYLDIQNGDRAWVHDVVFRDIRCEYSRYALPPVYQHDMNAPYPVPKEPYVPALIASPIYDGPWSEDHILGRTSDVLYQNIFVLADNGLGVPGLEFGGPDEAHANRRIMIDGVFFNGRRLGKAELPLDCSPFCDSIAVK